MRKPARPLSTKIDQAFIEANVIVLAESGCWIWMWQVSPKGYGMLKISQRPVLAHRLSYTLFVGPIPEGKLVCHSCDIPSCINPHHLWIGTHQENMRDMSRKGRANRRKNSVGEHNGRAKLSRADVRLIRDDHRIQRLIAADFGVSRSLISTIKSRKLWSRDE